MARQTLQSQYKCTIGTGRDVTNIYVRMYVFVCMLVFKFVIKERVVDLKRAL